MLDKKLQEIADHYALEGIKSRIEKCRKQGKRIPDWLLPFVEY